MTRDQDVTNLLHGREAAVRRWAAAGADLIVGGHIHLPFVLPLRERWPGLPRAMWAVQAGTAVSNRVRADAGNSVNVIRVGAAADAAAGAKIGHLADAAANIGDPAPAAGGAAGAARRCCVIERWDHAAAAQRFERAAVYRLEGTHVG